jgi:superkiller protein 3
MATKCDYGFSRLYADGYWSLGFMYVRESDLETNGQRKTELLNEAIKPLKQAIDVKQDYTNAYSLLAGIYLEQQKYEDAIEQYKKVLLYETKESNKGSIYSIIGFAYTQLGRYDEALNYLKRAVELAPNDPYNYSSLSLLYKAQGNFDEAIVQMKKMMELEKQATPKSYYFLASAYYNRARKNGADEDYVEAIRLSKKALEINNAIASVYLLLGHIYKFYKAGAMADEALANYKKAAEYEPNDPTIYFHLADLYFARKHNDEAAIEYFKKAIELKPDYAQAYWSLGQVYRHKKDDAAAIKQELKAIESDPKHLNAYFELADIYKAQKNYPEAIRYLERAAEIAHEDFYPYKELAKIYEAQQKNEEAIHYYKEAMGRLNADDSSTRNLYLGRIARLKAQYTEAIDYFRKVNFPDEPGQSYFEIGVTYVLSKNKRAAQEQHQQLLQLKSPLADELLKKIQEMK